MSNDYYDFNPSPAVWAVLLTGMVVFVLALSVFLIVGIARGEADGAVADAREDRAPDQLPGSPSAVAPARRDPTPVIGRHTPRLT